MASMNSLYSVSGDAISSSLLFSSFATLSSCACSKLSDLYFKRKKKALVLYLTSKRFIYYKLYQISKLRKKKKLQVKRGLLHYLMKTFPRTIASA